MAIKNIDHLIDKEDTFEIVRDRIAVILKAETQSQQTKAIAEAKDPDLWKFDVYVGRSNPWERWLNIDLTNPNINKTPIVNIWFDNSNFDPAASTIIKEQKSVAIYNIDIYTLGISKDENSGQILGDEDSQKQTHRIIRLIRNILMADVNAYLQLRNIVWSRWPDSITFWQPQLDAREVQRITGATIKFRVEFREYSPNITPRQLEQINVTLKRAEDDAILLEAEYK